jgi:hypothetical protein
VGFKNTIIYIVTLPAKPFFCTLLASIMMILLLTWYVNNDFSFDGFVNVNNDVQVDAPVVPEANCNCTTF